MSKKVFIALLFVYIGLGGAWESTGIAVFANKIFFHISAEKINLIAISQYLSTIVASIFGFLLLRFFTVWRLMLTAIMAMLIVFANYLIFPTFANMLLMYLILGCALTFIKASVYMCNQAFLKQDAKRLSTSLNCLEGCFFLAPFLQYLLMMWIVHDNPHWWRLVYLVPVLALSVAFFLVYNQKQALSLNIKRRKAALTFTAFLGNLQGIPHYLLVLIVASFAITGILNVWTPLIIFHFLHHAGPTFLLSGLTILALIFGRLTCAYLTRFVAPMKVARRLLYALLLLSVLFMTVHDPRMVYLIPLFSLFLGPVLIITSACFIAAGGKHALLLSFWVLILSALGDTIGIRAIGAVFQWLPIVYAFVVFMLIILLMILLQWVHKYKDCWHKPSAFV